MWKKSLFKLMLDLMFAVLFTVLPGCALLGPALSDCTKRVISAETQNATTSALALPEAPPAASSAPAPAVSTSSSSLSASGALPWETGVDNLAQGALSDVACVLQEVVQGALQPQPAPVSSSSAVASFSPQTGAEPPGSAAPVALLSTPAIAAARVPPPYVASAAPPPVASVASGPSPAILKARARTWLDHHCPGGRCSVPKVAK